MKEGPESLKELSRNDPCWLEAGKNSRNATSARTSHLHGQRTRYLKTLAGL